VDENNSTVNNIAKGHAAAFITIFIWGTTFIATKILLKEFSPVEILLYRFGVGFLALLIAYPRRLKGTNWKQELMFAAAGLCGITLYYLLENTALIYTSASNAGVICSVAPFFTALFANWFLDGEKQGIAFYIGFIAAIAGISIISFNGAIVFKINPLGDLLILCAAIVWGVYSILSRKISQFGYNTIQTTRRIFVYAILLMLPAVFLSDFRLGLERFTKPVNVFNMLFLGLGASALCFVTWNWAVRFLGAVKTSVYIYLIPVITVITSIIVLHERINWISGIGIVLTLTGLFVSERRGRTDFYNGQGDEQKNNRAVERNRK